MDDPPIPEDLEKVRQQFDEFVRGLRPDLHRYCARMTGSVIDGEDVLQDALAKAFYLLPATSPLRDMRAWLFRMAHNKSIDFLRRYDRRFGEPLDEHPTLVEETTPLEEREVAQLALPHFLQLTALQRSTVILKDVMGYSLLEISELLDASIPAIKGALHRGRVALREGGLVPLDAPPPLDVEQKRLLALYVDHFNGRRFDALRDLLAEDAKLELVGRLSSRGREAVGSYFGNYERLQGWCVMAGSVDGRPALIGFDDVAPALADAGTVGLGRPTFFVLIAFREGQVARIRDYRYARHTTELAHFSW